MTDNIISPDWAARIGVTTGTADDPEPTTMLDWALLWARRGLHVFPCSHCDGTELVSPWYSTATVTASKIVEWWSANKDADIAAVPDKSGHFVLIAYGDAGQNNLADLEEEFGPLPAEYRYFDHWGEAEHLWLKGQAMTSHHKLGQNLHVLGAGHYIYLPASWAPCHVWNRDE